MKLSVVGRGSPVAEVHCCDGVAVIRLDDSRDSERWTEVRLTEEQLRALLRRIAAEREPEALVTCDFCGSTSHLDAAIDAGWFPSYRSGETEREPPVCGICAAKHLVYDESTGDMVTRGAAR